MRDSIAYFVVAALYRCKTSRKPSPPPATGAVASTFKSSSGRTRKFGTVGSLCRGRSMQIQHEISLIVVCRMTEPGNRSLCGSRSDRPKNHNTPAIRATQQPSFRLVSYVHEPRRGKCERCCAGHRRYINSRGTITALIDRLAKRPTATPRSKCISETER